MSEFVSIIGSLGFPIGMCLIFVFALKYVYDNEITTLKDLTNVISKNTQVIEKLLDKEGSEK